eukprot:2888612-Amphidinium_carterae.2
MPQNASRHDDVAIPPNLPLYFWGSDHGDPLGPKTGGSGHSAFSTVQVSFADGPCVGSRAFLYPHVR